MQPDQDPSLDGEGLTLPQAGPEAELAHEPQGSAAADSARDRDDSRDGDGSLARAWDEVLEELRKLLNRQQMETWFRTALLRSAGPEGVVLVVQNSFTSNWLRSAPYITALETAVRNVFGAAWPVQIVVDPELVVRARSQTPAGPGAAPAPAATPRSRSMALLSITVSTTFSWSAKVPDWRSSWSTMVVFPWSTWAMMAMLRI